MMKKKKKKKEKGKRKKKKEKRKRKRRMSRKSRDQVWEQYFGPIPSGTCPCCGKTSIDKYEQNWEREHIIKMQYGGPDIMVNLIPICVKCNQDNKPYHNTYEYMSNIGRISLEDAIKYTENLEAEIKRYRENPDLLVCHGITQAGTRCTKQSLDVNYPFCRIHKKEYLKDLEKKNATWTQAVAYCKKVYGDWIQANDVVALWNEICGKVNYDCIPMSF